MGLRIRDFAGADFQPASMLLGTTRHAQHGRQSYWYGADELCAALAVCDHGFVMRNDDDALVGIILLASPNEGDRNPDMRSHWRGERTVILTVCRTMGISPRSDSAQAGDVSDTHPIVAQRLGKDAGLVVLFQTDPALCDERAEQELMERGLAWLEGRGAGVAGSEDESLRQNTEEKRTEGKTMDKIASFTVDHTRLEPGIYVSRVDKDPVAGSVVTTFDLRMTAPNREPVMNTAEIHTIEHLGATFLRNDSEWKDRVVYFGPMGCRTGFYLVLFGAYDSPDVVGLVTRMFEFVATFEGEIPGARPEECGNYLDQNLAMAHWLARRYLRNTLGRIDEAHLNYPG